MRQIDGVIFEAIYYDVIHMLSASEHLRSRCCYIPACLAGGIPACLAGLQGGGGIPACLAGLQAHTQGEREVSVRGGLQAHTQGVGCGVWPGGDLQDHTHGVG